MLNTIKRILTPRSLILSIAISLLIQVVSYVLGNTSIPLPDEMIVLQGWDKFKSITGHNKDSIPEEIMLVDVAYDKQLVNYEINGMPVGQYSITDRQKLLDFLTIAHQADNYKYILLDVLFEQGIESPQDSLLFPLIAKMNRIVIPVHEDIKLQDTVLYQKAANADYTVTFEETNFSHFQYIHEGIPSIPLKMYEDISGNTIKKWGWIYIHNRWLCRNGITLKMPIKLSEKRLEEDTVINYKVLNLGTDLIEMDSIYPVVEQIKNKIVVIGNFKDDIHDTYVGKQSGSIICLNAYYALQRGDHSLVGSYGGILLFYLLITFLYFVMSIAYLNGFSLAAISDNPWIKLVISLFSSNFIFWIIAILAYITPLDLVYNVWVPIATFSLLDFITNIYSSYKIRKK